MTKPATLRLKLLSLGLAALLAACALPLRIESGTWEMHTPAGATINVDIAQLRYTEYYLRAPGHSIAGVYEVVEDKLRVTKPDIPGMNGTVWKIGADGVLTLVEETPYEVSGVRLGASTLVKVH